MSSSIPPLQANVTSGLVMSLKRSGVQTENAITHVSLTSKGLTMTGNTNSAINNVSSACDDMNGTDHVDVAFDVLPVNLASKSNAASIVSHISGESSTSHDTGDHTSVVEPAELATNNIMDSHSVVELSPHAASSGEKQIVDGDAQTLLKQKILESKKTKRKKTFEPKRSKRSRTQVEGSSEQSSMYITSKDDVNVGHSGVSHVGDDANSTDGVNVAFDVLPPKNGSIDTASSVLSGETSTSRDTGDHANIDKEIPPTELATDNIMDSCSVELSPQAASIDEEQIATGVFNGCAPTVLKPRKSKRKKTRDNKSSKRLRTQAEQSRIVVKDGISISENEVSVLGHSDSHKQERLSDEHTVAKCRSSNGDPQESDVKQFLSDCSPKPKRRKVRADRDSNVTTAQVITKSNVSVSPTKPIIEPRNKTMKKSTMKPVSQQTSRSLSDVQSKQVDLQRVEETQPLFDSDTDENSVSDSCNSYMSPKRPELTETHEVSSESSSDSADAGNTLSRKSPLKRCEAARGVCEKLPAPGTSSSDSGRLSQYLSELARS